MPHVRLVGARMNCYYLFGYFETIIEEHQHCFNFRGYSFNYQKVVANRIPDCFDFFYWCQQDVVMCLRKLGTMTYPKH